MLFHVASKEISNAVFLVYAVRENSEGVIQFLIFTLSGWEWTNADEWTPYKGRLE
jgi:hypothetical protein